MSATEPTAKSGGYKMPEVEQLLDRVTDLIDQARPMPLSTSAMINKDEILDLLVEVRSRLPEELRASRWLLKEREEFLEKVKREGEDLLYRNLLDGSRAANRLGWQWTTGAGSGKPYGFSRWQVEKRAPGLCRDCALQRACPAAPARPGEDRVTEPDWILARGERRAREGVKPNGPETSLPAGSAVRTDLLAGPRDRPAQRTLPMARDRGDWV